MTQNQHLEKISNCLTNIEEILERSRKEFGYIQNEHNLLEKSMDKKIKKTIKKTSPRVIKKSIES